MKIDIVNEYTFDKVIPRNLSRVRTQMQSLESSPSNKFIESPKLNGVILPSKMHKNFNAMLSKIKLSNIKFKPGPHSFHPQIKMSEIKMGNVVIMNLLTMRTTNF